MTLRLKARCKNLFPASHKNVSEARYVLTVDVKNSTEIYCSGEHCVFFNLLLEIFIFLYLFALFPDYKLLYYDFCLPSLKCSC